MLSRPFRPAWWVPGAHAQTLWGKLVRRHRASPTRVERWEAPDGDFVDLVRLDATDLAAPRLVLLHGLEGTPRSHYVQGLFERTHAAGWAMDLVLHRSCGPELNRARRFYHSGETTDLAFVVDRLVAEDPARPLGLAGVSLGGNVLLKFLGERGPDLPPQLVAAVAVSVPYDLERGSRHISRGVSRLYERHFLRTLRRKVDAKRLRYPDLVDVERLNRVATLFDFDDVVTAPIHGFQDASDYYTRSSARHFLAGIRVPTLLVSAVDDPFLPAAVLDEVRLAARANPCLHVDFVPRGGHVGFVGGSVPWRPDYYAERRVVEFIGARAAAQTSRAPSAAGDAARPDTEASTASVSR